MENFRPETTLVLIGLVFNFVGMLCGGITVLFSVWRWLTAMRAELGERLTRVETEVKNLLRQQGLNKRTGD